MAVPGSGTAIGVFEGIGGSAGSASEPEQGAERRWADLGFGAAVCVWSYRPTGSFYGFAHGVEASGVPGSGEAAAAGSWVVSRSRATGLRAQRRGAMPLAALRGRLRGERPRLRGMAGTLAACVLLWVRSGSLVASSPDGSRPVRWRQAASSPPWSLLARLDATGPACLAAPADATRDPAPRCVRSVGTGRAQPRRRRPPPVPPRSGGRLAWSQGSDRRRPTSVPRHAARA